MLNICFTNCFKSKHTVLMRFSTRTNKNPILNFKKTEKMKELLSHPEVLSFNYEYIYD